MRSVVSGLAHRALPTPHPHPHPPRSHGHTYLRQDLASHGFWHVMAGGSGNDEMPYPADQNVTTSTLSAAESCLEWCSSPAVRGSFAAADGDVKIPSHAPGGDPCRYCAGSPVYATAKMVAGVLTSTPTQLKWQLLLAPRGEVLDEVTVTRS